MTEALYYVFATITVISAILVIVFRNPLYSAISLVVTFFSLAVIFLSLEAYFLAVVQVIVYAGAIMVLFLFVIMLLNLKSDEKFMTIAQPRTLVGFGLAALFVVLLMLLVIATLGSWADAPETTAGMGSPEGIGTVLFTKYLLPFEIASLLLLVALVGAVLLAKGRLR